VAGNAAQVLINQPALIGDAGERLRIKRLLQRILELAGLPS